MAAEEPMNDPSGRGHHSSDPLHVPLGILPAHVVWRPLWTASAAFPLLEFQHVLWLQQNSRVTQVAQQHDAIP